jgi:hypothetical protein
MAEIIYRIFSAEISNSLIGRLLEGVSMPVRQEKKRVVSYESFV